jgi:oligopeptide transport system permease protein
MKLKGQEFILASRTIGASDLRMIMKHFIPNIMGQMIIMITFSIPGAIFYEAFLAFIGLGVPPPYASLGVLINDGYKLMKTAPHLMLIPSVVLSTLMLSLNLFANGLRDALDPKMRNL